MLDRDTAASNNKQVQKKFNGKDELPLSLRTSELNDREFLQAVYADSRWEEMLKIGHWDTNEKAQFLQFQFHAQDVHYREHYPVAEYLIVQLGEIDIGRLYIERQKTQICVMDIAILHSYRQRGIARQLLDDILQEAEINNQKVMLHVEPDNFAKQLYLSLGFKVTKEISLYQRMEWQS